MQDIFFTNTLSGKKEKFEPLSQESVRMYSCGPTVYDFAHIGNFRSFIFSDILARTLTYAGYKVIKAQNITDVGHLTADDLADATGEDKIAKKAKNENEDPFEIARFFESEFKEDEKFLRIQEPTYRPRATDYIAEQIQITQTLLEKNYAYEANGSVYFETEKFKDYGKLSKNKLEDLKAGARVEINDEKKNPLDFALWKKADESHLMQWQSPWGKGFPGWHIECSTMSQKLLGEQFDIHTGGEDNCFPHHECEIAQNEASTGKHPCVKYWMHVKHLLVNGEKMSKSKGNFFTIKDLKEKGWKGEEIRYALFTAHYRSTLNFSEDLLTQARSSIARIREGNRILKENASKNTDGIYKKELQKEFQNAIFDDLNTSDALAIVFKAINTGLKEKEDNTLSPEKAASIKEFLQKDVESIFNILNPDQTISEHEQKVLEQKIHERTQAKQEKDFQKADEIRKKIYETFPMIELIDTKDGTTWKLK